MFWGKIIFAGGRSLEEAWAFFRERLEAATKSCDWVINEGIKDGKWPNQRATCWWAYWKKPTYAQFMWNVSPSYPRIFNWSCIYEDINLSFEGAKGRWQEIKDWVLLIGANRLFFIFGFIALDWFQCIWMEFWDWFRNQMSPAIKASYRPSLGQFPDREVTMILHVQFLPVQPISIYILRVKLVFLMGSKSHTDQS